MNSKHIFGIIFVLFLLLIAPIVFAEVQPISVNEMNDKATYTVLDNGDVKVEEIITLSASSYQNFKNKYPTISMFARLFKPKNIPIQIENLNINMDEMNNKINATYLIKGWAVNKGEYWEIIGEKEGEKLTLSAQTGNTLVFTVVSQSGDFKQTTTSTVVFPSDAKNIKFESSTNKITYELPYKGGIGNLIFLGLAVFFIGAAAVNHLYLKY